MVDVRPTRSAKVENVFVGEGYFDLQLRIGEVMQLEEVRDCGIFEILQRLSTRTFRVADIKESIRLALIGAGMDRRAAFELVERNVIAGYLLEMSEVATIALQAAIIGVEHDPPGEPGAVTTETEMETNSETNADESAGPSSSETAAPQEPSPNK